MATAQDEAILLMRELYLNTKINFKVYICPLRQMKIHLRQMLKRYEQWCKVVKYRKNLVNIGTEKKRFEEFERYIVHYLLEICFWVSFGDSDVVSDLLIIFYEADGHFEEIFCETPVRRLDTKKYGLEDLDKIVRKPWSWEEMVENPLTGNVEIEGRQKERMKYFIKHAFENKLLFLRFGEHWLKYKMKTNPVPTNVMARNSLFFTDPDILTKFLELGLFANADKRDKTVAKLLMDVINILKSGGFTDSSYPSDGNYKALEAAVLFVRAVKSVEFPVSYKSEQNNVLTGTTFWGPGKLKHLCRWQIRNQLCDCGQLPDGISFLPIPKPLQQYLNLRTD